MPTLNTEISTDSNVRLPTTRRTGLAIPLAQNKSGGLFRVTGDSNDAKLIGLALRSTDSENPFQQPSDSIDSAVFEIDDAAVRAILLRKLETVFDDFEREHRYRLVDESIEFRRDEDGELTLFFDYHSLEADEIRTLSLGPR